MWWQKTQILGTEKLKASRSKVAIVSHNETSCQLTASDMLTCAKYLDRAQPSSIPEQPPLSSNKKDVVSLVLQIMTTYISRLLINYRYFRKFFLLEYGRSPQPLYNSFLKTVLEKLGLLRSMSTTHRVCCNLVQHQKQQFFQEI